MTRLRRRRATCLGLSGWVVVLVIALPSPVAIRSVVLFGFVGLCPGLAWVGLIRRCDPLERLVFGVALSISLAVLVTEAMALTHRWSVLFGVSALATITTCGAVVQLNREWKTPRQLGRGQERT